MTEVHLHRLFSIYAHTCMKSHLSPQYIEHIFNRRWEAEESAYMTVFNKNYALRIVRGDEPCLLAQESPPDSAIVSSNGKFSR